ncbi:MAG: hypothetical protein RR942_06420 [Romboutsia sp.]
MSVIDFNKAKEKKLKNNRENEKEADYIMRREILQACLYIGALKYDRAIKLLESTYNKYKGKCRNLKNYLDIYRYLGLAYSCVGDELNSDKYYGKLKLCLNRYEKELLKNYPHAYVINSEEYYNNNKNKLNKRESIRINRKILECCKQNNFHAEQFTAKARIEILKENYEEVVDSLSRIHNDNEFDKEERKILNELKENNTEEYYRYLCNDKVRIGICVAQS